MPTTTSYADLVLNNNTGGTVSVVEVKAYPKITKHLKQETLNQLEEYSKHLDPQPLRYLTILSKDRGYVKDLKSQKEIEFDLNPILNDYLDKNELKDISPRLLNYIYSAWLRDLSLGLREKLTEPEKELEKFGFVNEIKDTFPWHKYSPKDD